MKSTLFIPIALLVTAIGAMAAEPQAPAADAASATQSAAAGIGAWTTDYAAAKKVAAERHLPLFIQFTGSDWCGWCQKMEKECLSQPEFLEAMKTRCVLVNVDFPRKTEQPAALKAQNSELSAQFKGRGGFPSYYIVDSDAKTVHWSFGAHPKYGKDLKLLISDIDGFCAGCTGPVERATKGLAADKAEAYRNAAKTYAAKMQSVAGWLDQKHPDGAAAKKEFEGYLQEIATLRTAMTQVVEPTAAATTQR